MENVKSKTQMTATGWQFANNDFTFMDQHFKFHFMCMKTEYIKLIYIHQTVNSIYNTGGSFVCVSLHASVIKINVGISLEYHVK